MLARELSVRDIEYVFRDENGRLLLSKTAVSQLGERLWEDYQTFVCRLAVYDATVFASGLRCSCLGCPKRADVVLFRIGGVPIRYRVCGLPVVESSADVLVLSARLTPGFPAAAHSILQSIDDSGWGDAVALPFLTPPR